MNEPLLFVGCTPKFTGNNTFRRGRKWADAVTLGRQLDLADAHTKRVFGRATVTGIVTGTLGQLLDWHAESNHAITDADPRDISNAGDYLWDVLRTIYGKDISLDEEFTVLFLNDVV